jgi:hypothetical protein
MSGIRTTTNAVHAVVKNEEDEEAKDIKSGSEEENERKVYDYERYLLD